MVILPIIYQTSVKSDVEQAFNTHEILCGEPGDPINWLHINVCGVPSK